MKKPIETTDYICESNCIHNDHINMKTFRSNVPHNFDENVNAVDPLCGFFGWFKRVSAAKCCCLSTATDLPFMFVVWILHLLLSHKYNRLNNKFAVFWLLQKKTHWNMMITFKYVCVHFVLIMYNRLYARICSFIS